MITGKGRGIVTNMHVCKGTFIAMYGGDIIDINKLPEGGGSHVLSMKESGKTLVILDGYKCKKLPEIAQGALADEPDQGCTNAQIVWLSWSHKRSLKLFRIPVIKTVKDIDEGQEITIKYSSNIYYLVSIAY